jgi:hypothetical protein
VSNLKNLTGEGINKGMDHNSGGTMMTGDGIDFYRLLTIHKGLKLQKHGIKLSSRLPAATTLARKHLGLKGNLQSLTDQVGAIIERIQEERQVDYVCQDAIEERKTQGGDDDA